MRRVCTVTGKCPEKFPCVKNADGTLYSEPRPCPYYTRTGTAEVIDWPGIAEGYRSTFGLMDDRISELFDLSESLIAAFEELAGEHRELRENHRRLYDQLERRYGEVRVPDSPGPGWYWVRGHWRSRLSPIGETRETLPETRGEASETDTTGETSASDPGASEGQPGALDGQTLWQCEDCGKVVSRMDHDCVPPPPEGEMCVQEHTERSE